MSNTTRAALAVASIHAADLAGALTEALSGSDERDTATPGEVVGLIDDTLRQLYKIRERAVGENRRRFDAAMRRSAELLGLKCDRCGDVDHAPYTCRPVPPGEARRTTRP